VRQWPHSVRVSAAGPSFRDSKRPDKRCFRVATGPRCRVPPRRRILRACAGRWNDAPRVVDVKKTISIVGWIRIRQHRWWWQLHERLDRIGRDANRNPDKRVHRRYTNQSVKNQRVNCAASVRTGTRRTPKAGRYRRRRRLEWWEGLFRAGYPTTMACVVSADSRNTRCPDTIAPPKTPFQRSSGSQSY
jgi:hypothetical protein